jgi:hypothetical protein
MKSVLRILDGEKSGSRMGKIRIRIWDKYPGSAKMPETFQIGETVPENQTKHPILSSKN